MVTFGYTNPIGWLAFLSLLPLIALYFTRPKPKEMEIPSLMFLEKTYQLKNTKGFLKKFVHDWLLLLQLLILALLSLFFVNPYILSDNLGTEHVTFVIDSSASMDIHNNLEAGKKYAEARLGKSNTIISVGSNPYLLLEEGSASEAKTILKTIDLTDERTSLNDALALAEEKTQQIITEKKIVLVTDYRNTEGMDINTQIQSIMDQGILVESFTPKTKAVENVGIIDLDVGEQTSEIIVRNFCCEEKTLTIHLGESRETITLATATQDVITFPTPDEQTTIFLEESDDFKADNTIYLTNPQQQTTTVTLITDDESPHLSAALRASPNIALDIISSTRTIRESDVYILHNLNTFSTKLANTLEDALESGKTIIIHADDNIGDYKGLLPFDIKDYGKGSDSVITQSARFTENVEFGRVDKIATLSCKEACGTTFVTNNDEALIFIDSSKQGNIAYYGIHEDASGFKNTPGYPLFWIRLIETLQNAGSISSAHLLTGSILQDGGETQLLRTAGFHTAQNMVYAANLLNRKESSVHEPVIFPTLLEETEEQQTGKEIWKLVLIAALILLFVEYILSLMRNSRRKYYA